LEVIIIDDEQNAIKSLKWELTHFCEDVEVKATFTKASEAIPYLKSHEVDCIFLDIEMPELDGFQFLDQFPHRNFEVVFVTAYDKYAIDAIKESAVDYLLKPIDSDDLVETIQKLSKKIKLNHSSDFLEESLRSLSDQRISVPIDGKLIFLSTEELVYCESDGNYCKLFLTNNETLFVTRKLKEIHELLPEKQFYRVHNSYVVNLQKVKEYLKTDGILVMDNKKKIPVSRSRKSSFLAKM
jgi:two-component system LytT family response regulator